MERAERVTGALSAREAAPGAEAQGVKRSVEICIIGSGLMGRGIARLLGGAGHEVLLYDIDIKAAQKGAEKSPLIKATNDFNQLQGADLIIEAAPEDLKLKQELLQRAEELAPNAILASNTSSLNITALGQGLKNPQNLAGLHFFNPAHLMPLVEIIPGLKTAPQIVQTLKDLALKWGKEPLVLNNSPPGFVVNRIARPFYGEAFRLLEQRAAPPQEIDLIWKEGAGFALGPFEVIRLVGNPTNWAVTNAVYNATFQDPRYRPSPIQQEMLWAGLDYPPGFPPLPRPAAGFAEYNLRYSDGRRASQRAEAEGISNLILVDHIPNFAQVKRVTLTAAAQTSEKALAAAIAAFEELGLEVSLVKDSPGLVILRGLALMAAEALGLLEGETATAAEIDLGVQKGLKHPRGIIAWAKDFGADELYQALENIGGLGPILTKSLIRARLNPDERK